MAAGALVGAAACGIVVVWVSFAIDAPPKHDNWDWATPLLMLLFAAGAAVVGAAAWGFAAVRLAAGEWRAPSSPWRWSSRCPPRCRSSRSRR